MAGVTGKGAMTNCFAQSLINVVASIARDRGVRFSFNAGQKLRWGNSFRRSGFFLRPQRH